MIPLYLASLLLISYQSSLSASVTEAPGVEESLSSMHATVVLSSVTVPDTCMY